MSDFKGTPGPWEARLIHGDLHVIRSGSFRKEGGRAVSYQPVVDAIDDADDANLIAAAPELLEALQEIKRAMDSLYDLADKVGINDADGFWLGHAQGLSQRAESAIKKALGQ